MERVVSPTPHTSLATVGLQAVPLAAAALEELEARGLIACFRPTARTQNPPSGENVAEWRYESAPEFGPHKLIAVGVGKTSVRLGLHPDNEEFLTGRAGLAAGTLDVGAFARVWPAPGLAAVGTYELPGKLL